MYATKKGSVTFKKNKKAMIKAEVQVCISVFFENAKKLIMEGLVEDTVP